MSRIFWDTNLFIYLVEGRGRGFELTQRVMIRMAERRDDLFTSALTLGELLVKPIELKQPAMAETYERLLSTRGIHIIDFGREAARVYAGVRQDRTMRAPDAVQLACASTAGINLFITNDGRLSQKRVRGVDFIVGLEQAFL